MKHCHLNLQCFIKCHYIRCRAAGYGLSSALIFQEVLIEDFLLLYLHYSLPFIESSINQETYCLVNGVHRLRIQHENYTNL